MSIVRAAAVALLLLILPGYAFSEEAGWMRISFMEGDVQLKTPESEDWGPAALNGPVTVNDQVWVPQGSRVELQLNNGTFIRLDENTALNILSVDKDSSQFYLSQGRAYIYYRGKKGTVLQFDTPDISTRTYGRAVFRIDMSEQYSDVSVYRGKVEVENRAGRTRVEADEMVSLGQETDAEVGPMGPPDEWEKWNKKRNDLYRERKASKSIQYLPEELGAYSNDLDEGGRWVRVPEYGYVWTPTIVVGVSWSPYRDGRWIWRGGHYVWVGRERWGWAPYHYGRWAFAASVGWFWVPPVRGDVFWSPGYVGWVRTPEYVAWVPLAPGEMYYGRGHYGRHSVNITNVTVNQVNIINVYKNVNINNGVTVINRNSFTSGTPQVANIGHNVIREKIFVKNNVSIGAPDIKPTRASHFASSAIIPPAKLPPPAIKGLHVDRVRESRPFVKDSGKSVLNPGIKPHVLPVNKVTTPRTPGKDKPTTIQPVTRGERGRPGLDKGPADKTGGAVKGDQPKEKGKPDVHGGPTSPTGPTGRPGRDRIQGTDKGRPGLDKGPADKTGGAVKGDQPKEKGKPDVHGGPTSPAGRPGRDQIQGTDKGRTIDKPVQDKTVKPVEKPARPVRDEVKPAVRESGAVKQHPRQIEKPAGDSSDKRNIRGRRDAAPVEKPAQNKPVKPVEKVEKPAPKVKETPKPQVRERNVKQQEQQKHKEQAEEEPRRKLH